ncbi:MAG: hypothetical protein ABI689_03460, partial [Thermoanaerobaculia bacterium]
MNLLRLALGFVAAALAGAGVAAAQPYIPIPDLVAPYLGVGEPGLYPGGSNAPTGAHLTYGQTRAAAVTPRDSAGNPDADGWIGLVYLGMSNCNQEGSRFEREADRFGEHAGRVVIVDAAKGGIDAFLMDEASDAYWTAFDQRLAAAGVDPDQVQVAWFENTQASEATSGNFPARIDALRAAYRGVILTLTARCPNLQLVFLTSRSWTPATARQTFAFETGFAMKGLIQDQLDDVDGLGSGPWLGWGPYTWADGP